VDHQLFSCHGLAYNWNDELKQLFCVSNRLPSEVIIALADASTMQVHAIPPFCLHCQTQHRDVNGGLNRESLSEQCEPLRATHNPLKRNSQVLSFAQTHGFSRTPRDLLFIRTIRLPTKRMLDINELVRDGT